MKYYAIIIGVLCCMYICTAQETFSPAQRINEIKKSPDLYLYAESTAETWEEAQENARYLLCMEVENTVKDLVNKDSIAGYVTKAQQMILELKSMRGERYRAFVYVRRADLLPYSEGEHVLVVPAGNGNTVTLYTPEPALPQENSQTLFVLTDLEKQMLTVLTGNSIASFVEQQKSWGKIMNYGRYRDMPTDCNCVIFVYNQSQQIVAYLRKEGSCYVNLKTKQPDEITNYKGCGAIWLQPK